MKKYLCVLFFLMASPAAAETLVGSATKVIDGATLLLSTGQRVRLFGVIAPAATQKCERDHKCMPCGEEARTALEQLAAGALRCETWGRSMGRIVARCYGRGDVDLGLAMLKRGQVAVFKKYLRRNEQLPFEYLDAEAGAKRQGFGMWAGEAVDPWYWRHAAKRLACEY